MDRQIKKQIAVFRLLPGLRGPWRSLVGTVRGSQAQQDGQLEKRIGPRYDRPLSPDLGDPFLAGPGTLQTPSSHGVWTKGRALHRPPTASATGWPQEGGEHAKEAPWREPGLWEPVYTSAPPRSLGCTLAPGGGRASMNPTAAGCGRRVTEISCPSRSSRSSVSSTGPGSQNAFQTPSNASRGAGPLRPPLRTMSPLHRRDVSSGG